MHSSVEAFNKALAQEGRDPGDYGAHFIINRFLDVKRHNIHTPESIPKDFIDVGMGKAHFDPYVSHNSTP